MSSLEDFSICVYVSGNRLHDLTLATRPYAEDPELLDRDTDLLDSFWEHMDNGQAHMSAHEVQMILAILYDEDYLCSPAEAAARRRYGGVIERIAAERQWTGETLLELRLSQDHPYVDRWK